MSEAAEATDILGMSFGHGAQRSTTQAPARVGGVLERLLNAVAALFFIVLGLPLFIGIALLILIVDGRPVLYRGTRLGRNGKPYTIYKFRTLVRGANREVGAELVSFRHRVTIPCGRFLRDTRLDELPQLFNILKGDMNFAGPRPERPEVYDRACRHLNGYSYRFRVKPGLSGYSQLFTPHSSPKRLRKLTDRLALRGVSPHPFWDALCVGRTIAAVAKMTSRKIVRSTWDDLLRTRILRLHRNRRELTRKQPRNAEVLLDLESGSRTIRIPIEDVNETALLLRSPEKIVENGALSFKIQVRFQRRLRASGKRVRVARCTGQITQTRPARGGWHHVVRYEPTTEWNQYIIDQYLLRSSIVSPFW